MTTSHLDIVARPDADTAASVLLSGLFEQLHREFVARSLSSVGISFPDAEPGAGLGKRLRLHGTQDELQALSRMPWLERASDYYRMGAPKGVPPGHELRVVRRLQPKLSAAKVRRMVVRGKVSEERALELLDGRSTLDAPFVQIASGSSGQRFRLFFEQIDLGKVADDGRFNAYGFGSRVPWF